MNNEYNNYERSLGLDPKNSEVLDSLDHFNWHSNGECISTS